MKVVFLGTPEFATPSLEKLILDPEIEVLALITQPDRATGRKQITSPPPCKILAEKYNIKILQPEKLNQDHQLIKYLEEIKADFFVSCAYGQIIKEKILSIAPVINVHASLLPEYRGPAPINWMLIHGETQVGITTMLSDLGIDTGDILLKSSIIIDEEIKADELSKKLSLIGSQLLIETIKNFSKLKPIKQEAASDQSKQLAPFMDKQLGKICFTDEYLELRSANPKQHDFVVLKKNSAKNIHNLIRGTYPWPGAYFMRDEQKIIITDSYYKPVSSKDIGKLVSIDKENGSISVQTHDGQLIIKKLKPQNKSEQEAISWVNGQRLRIGDYLEN